MMYIYFVKPIGHVGPIKIGLSGNPTARLMTLMSWSPFPLEIITTIAGDYALETNIHECFAAEHTHREWFTASDRLLEFVRKVSDGVPPHEASDLTVRTKLMTAKQTPEAKFRASYTHRMSWAARKLGANVKSGCFYPPDDVGEIMDRWRGFRSGEGEIERREPNGDDLLRLDEVLDNPGYHFNLHTWDGRVILGPDVFGAKKQVSV